MKRIIALLLILSVYSCDAPIQNVNEMKKKVDEFAPVELKTDLSTLSERERLLIPIFIDIAKIMDELFWIQAYGNKADFDDIDDVYTIQFIGINYGPWERLNNNIPFVEGYDSKPAGANFYPKDMTPAEFNAIRDKAKNSQYTVIVRNPDGSLEVVPYRLAYKDKLDKAIELMNKAILLADDPGLKKYLQERVKAFKTDDYFASDMAWMDMKSSRLDFVVGPIENYEDKLFGYKTAYEAFVLVKDIKWSNDLSKFIKMLPQLQRELPCDDKYKKEVPGVDSDLNVYDAIYYAGDCNAGSKTIAINLPNDERVHAAKGARRLQLKNTMKAKFDHILKPIGDLIIHPNQRENVKFDAFFWNVTFHEVAHGLGIKNTLTKKGTVRQALKEQYSAWEEAKADILGLFMVENLIEKGEITNISVDDAYTTFIAGILRSVRFGAASAHGKANMMCYNFFQHKGAFIHDNDGFYNIDVSKAKSALREWAALILKVQGDGDYEFAAQYVEENGSIRLALEADLQKIAAANIPKDISFIQGLRVLNL